MNVTSGSTLKFREDGLREPPLFTASNNLIIMIVGLSILIVPVVGFLFCLCARTKLFQTIRVLKFTSPDGDSGLPYSQFDSEPDEVVIKPTKKAVVPQDARVLMNKDNTISGSPSKGSRIVKNSLNPSQSSSSIGEDFGAVDATFVVSGHLDADADADASHHSYRSVYS